MHGEKYFSRRHASAANFPAARTYGHLGSYRAMLTTFSRNILSAWQVLRNRDRSFKIAAIAIRREVSRALLDKNLRAMLVESAKF